MKTGIIAFLLVACGFIAASQSRAQGFPGNFEAVYDSDDRLDYGQITDDRIRKVARASVAIFQRHDLVRLGQYTWQKAPSVRLFGEAVRETTNGRNLPVCASNAFVKQRLGSMCSGTLIAPDLVATAGHCFDELYPGLPKLETLAFVFGNFAKNSSHAGEHRFSFRQVYFGKEIVKGAMMKRYEDKPGWIRRKKVGEKVDFKEDFIPRGSQEDWAIIRLDRPVSPDVAEPVAVRKGRIPDNARIAAFGYPDGLPLKYAPGAQVRGNGYDKYFIANLDTFRGNSGSGVYLEDTFEMVGILVRGEDDYIENTFGRCAQTNVCKGANCSGEDVNRIEVAWP